MDEEFLTTEEVFDYLQIHPRTLYRLLKSGMLPAVRVGRQWRIRKQDLDTWVAIQRQRRTRKPIRRPSGAPPGRARVLVVDDEQTIRDLLSRTLMLADYEVDVAPNGQVALDRMRITNYDLLITDLRMPTVDGLSVIREARRLKSDIPVLIVTGYSTEASAIEAINLGVQGYLIKPFRVPRVLAAAAKALGEVAS
jgi:excisionase family DNA binding protein